MTKILKYAIRGVGYGAVAYLLLIAFSVAPTNVFPKNVVSLLLVSGAIGVLSMIFDSDHEEVAWPLAFGIHFVGTAALILGLMFYNNWSIGIFFWVEFVVIYVVIWAVVMLNQHLRVSQINQALKQRAKHKS
ncbi:DUF3021 domain-containing protein [Levilactobacillus wangkuiensis]|uniref:DUF3021 domain-containing protein n=1 Tax=Levilactobacillus wangkuiensis TaxID=2799566 RepID=UPI001940AEBF|nr:DUF3021 domain-containing protein [Levilactobacillus wangkuiensis]